MTPSTITKSAMMSCMISAAMMSPAASESMQHHERFYKSPAERTAFEQVSLQCAADVERMCVEPPPPVMKERETMEEDDAAMNFFFPLLAAILANAEGGEGTFVIITGEDVEGENFDQEQQNRQVQQQDQQQFEENPFDEMDRIMTSLFFGVPSFTTTILISDDVEDETSPVDEASTASTATTVVDHVMEHVAKNTHPDHVEQVSQRLMEHGLSVLEDDDYFVVQKQEQGEDVAVARRHMARRLTEVASTDNIRSIQRRLLPFSCKQSQCLRDAHQQNLLSDGCGSSMNHLEQVRDLEEKAVVHGLLYQDMVEQQKLDEVEDAVISGFILFLFSFMVLVGCKAYCCRDSNKERQFQLFFKIFNAIYTRPHIKSAVEKDLGESIGDKPPAITDVAMKNFFAVARDDEAFQKNVNKLRTKQLAVFFFTVSLLFIYLQQGTDAAWLFFLQVIVSYFMVRACCCCCKMCCGGGGMEGAGATVGSMILGAMVGSLIGFVVLGPVGAIVGVMGGAMVGRCCCGGGGCCGDDCCDDDCCDDDCCDDDCCDDGCCSDSNETKTTDPKKVPLLYYVEDEEFGKADEDDGNYVAPLQVI